MTYVLRFALKYLAKKGTGGSVAKSRKLLNLGIVDGCSLYVLLCMFEVIHEKHDCGFVKLVRQRS